MILEMTLMGKVESKDHRHNVLLASQAMVATSVSAVLLLHPQVSQRSPAKVRPTRVGSASKTS